MKSFYIIGRKGRKSMRGVEVALCIMQAESTEIVLDQAKMYYGAEYVTGALEVGSVEAAAWSKGG